MFNPIHGGDVQQASKIFGRPIEEWLDLSTGMNPKAYPVKDIPTEAFTQLPYLNEGFLKAAQYYYGSSDFLALSGTQSAIQVLPDVLSDGVVSSVLLPSLGYQEHHNSWVKSGVKLNYYNSLENSVLVEDIDAQLEESSNQHLVLIRPNNPTLAQVDIAQVLAWSKKLSEQCYVIVDEAFIDVCPDESLLTLGELPRNIIVLRSFGKYFGLAGIRLGFVFAHQAVLDKLSALLGIWQVNGPAQYLAAQALQDEVWQASSRIEIVKDYQFTRQLLSKFFIENHFLGGSLGDCLGDFPQLFITLKLDQLEAERVYLKLAQAGVLTRLLAYSDKQSLLRFGLLNREEISHRDRLDEVLSIL